MLRKFLIYILTFCNYFVLSFNRQLAYGATRPLYRWLRMAAVKARPILPIDRIAALRERVLRFNWSAKPGRVASFHMYGLRDAGRTEVDLAALVPPQMVDFGKHRMPVPADCDVYLKGLFGKYQQPPPPDKRSPCHIRDVDFGDVQVGAD